MESTVGRKGSSFTINGHFFALLSVDGRLRIWDTASGKLVQEFSPALHVESSCTCLCWTRDDQIKKEPRRKRRKVEKHEDNSSKKPYPSIVLGTKNGVLATYDPVSGEIGKKYVDGHTKLINDVVYCESSDTLYSCSDDKHIVEWCYDSQEVKSKWKADKVSVKRICIGPSGQTMLSAGRCIKLWNLETKILLQRFHGHTSSISLLQFSPFCLSQTESGIADDGYYFLTGSTEDRVINAWHINVGQPEKTAIASYMLSDVPLFMDSSLCSEDVKPLKLCVGCKDGRIHFFSNTMNGLIQILLLDNLRKTSRPLQSCKTLDLLQKEGERSNATAIPFINAQLCNSNNDMVLMLVSGISLKPMFKKFIYSKLDVTSRIIQELSKNMLLKDIISDSDSTVELANQNIKTKVIGNANFIPVPPKGTARPKLDMNGNEDRSNTTSEENIISMEERLEVTGPDNSFVLKMKPSKSTPNASSFAQMLIQGLHSGDNVLISDILFKPYKENVLRNTVRRIPNNLVGLLLSEVVDKLQRNPARSKNLSPWLRVIMSVHLAYLTTNENLYGTLSNLYHLLKSQQDIHPHLANLSGKIDLLFMHASGNKQSSSEEDEVGTAAVVFNDNSDDETEELFGKLIESDEVEIEEDDEHTTDNEDMENKDDKGQSIEEEGDDSEMEEEKDSENESDRY